MPARVQVCRGVDQSRPVGGEGSGWVPDVCDCVGHLDGLVPEHRVSLHAFVCMFVSAQGCQYACMSARMQACSTCK